jgi:Fe2+ or Zn2+ uptake regulation protein
MVMSFEEASQRVHSAGLRMTRPREILLQLVLSSVGPFSVKMLHERAESADLNIHLATVHRNLAEFVEMGLVDEMPGEDNRLYMLHQEQESAAHVFCLDCRQIMPLDGAGFVGPEGNDALSAALAQRGFDAATVRMMLAAHCKIQNKAEKPQPCPKTDSE